MLELPSSWFCDKCGELIEQADHGWVEWITLSDSRPGRDIRIVHHISHSPRKGGCQFDSNQEYAKDQGTVGDYSLVEFMGPNGLTRLLEMIALEKLPTRELLEIIKRIHLPGYEHARRHFAGALEEGIIELNVEPGYWWQDELQRVLDYAARKG
jgi:hypothetical protein